MAFQDELRDILVGFVPEDKKEEFTEKSAGIFEKMGTVFNESAASIAAQKTKIRELEAKAQTVTSADPEEFNKVLRQLEERDKIVESKQKELDDVNLKFQSTSKQNKEFEKLAKKLQDQVDKESRILNETVKAAELRKAISSLSLKDPSMSDEVFGLLSGDIKIDVGEDGTRRVYARMKGDSGVEMEVTPLDYIKNWADTSVLAKSILAPPRSSGSGASGAGGAGSIGGSKSTEQLYQEALASGRTELAIMLKAKLASEMKD